MSNKVFTGPDLSWRRRLMLVGVAGVAWLVSVWAGLRWLGDCAYRGHGPVSLAVTCIVCGLVSVAVTGWWDLGKFRR